MRSLIILYIGLRQSRNFGGKMSAKNRDVEAGEELTTCYIPRELPLDDRREMLWNQWGFWCTCPRCQREEKEEQDAELINKGN